MSAVDKVRTCGRNATAFVSCSFHEEDQNEFVANLLEFIHECGISTQMLKLDVRAGRTSEVITAAIRDSGFFIAVLTKRKEGNCISPYLLQELGAALAFEKQVVILCEAELEDTDLGMGGEFTFVRFKRGELSQQLRQWKSENSGERTGGPKEPMDTLQAIEKLLKDGLNRFRSGLTIIDEHTVMPSTNGDRLRRALKVRELPEVGPWMNFETFFAGVSHLFEQIHSEPTIFRPDYFVGVNATGATIASYLNGRIFYKDLRPFGVVVTGDYRMESKRSFNMENLLSKNALLEILKARNLIPRQKSAKIRVLVVDSQIKRGQSVLERSPR